MKIKNPGNILKFYKYTGFSVFSPYNSKKYFFVADVALAFKTGSLLKAACRSG